MSRKTAERRLRERTAEDEGQIRSLLNCDRRRFLQLTGSFGALAATAGIVPAHTFQLLNLERPGEAPGTGFRIAYLSDTHLFAKGRTQRHARAALRAIEALNALDPQPDFVVFGGDLARSGHRDELLLGQELLSELRAPVRMVVGEADYYLDMGDAWRDLFGPDHYAFDHRGTRFLVLNSIQMEDFWSASRLDPAQRMAIAGGLDDTRKNAFHLGDAQLRWVAGQLADLPATTPIAILSHAPLYRLYKPWNFWTEDADSLHALLRRFDSVSVLHGHTHQLLTHRIGNIGFFGMLSTSMPWPEAPTGLPELTIRSRAGSQEISFEAGGSGTLDLAAMGLATKTYHPWNDVRRSMTREGPVDTNG